uniref:Pentatricopeptide repeat-containing protein n=1 Tax=Kalanchoe fedtschenkoi TaxID=63787 RepID=A0A7N0SVC9_KALFE
MSELVILLNAPSLTLVQSPNPYHRHRHRRTSPLISSHLNSSSYASSKSSPVSNFSSRIANTSTTLVDSRDGSAFRAAPDRNSLRDCSELASNLAGDGRLEEFLLVAEGVVGSGMDVFQFVADLDVEMVAKGIGGIIKEGKVWDVVEFLRRAEVLGISALKVFDKSCKQILAEECRRMLQCKKVKEVVELMEVLTGFQFRVKELADPHVIINQCVQAGDPELAVRYASIYTHAPILFCDIINEFGKKKDLRSALKAFETSNQKLSAPNMYAYRSMIDICGQCGNYAESRVIYEDLMSQKVIPNIFVFNSLMNANSHDLGYTLNIYRDMQNLGVMADMASFNILLKSCCLAGRVDLAQDIYREVKEKESKGILKLDVFTYCTIIKVFADAKLWQMALMIKDDMILAGVHPNTVTWSSLISACANAGLVEPSMQLFQEMLETACEEREIADIENVHKYNGPIIPSFISNPRHLALARKIPFAPTITTYNTLMKACGTDYNRAKALMDEMKNQGLSPDQISWSIMMDICGDSGNVEGALQMMKSMRQSGMRPDVVSYTTAIKICVQNKRFNLAFSLFEEMKRYRVQPNLVTYNTLLMARSRYGFVHEVQQCLAIYLDMRKAGYKSNDLYLEELIEEWCEGVIQDKSQKLDQINCDEDGKGGPQSLLLEKLASHLNKNNAESHAINLQGHSKIEARIVVLAVLRMIKEKYAAGVPIRDDMLIILGTTLVDHDLPNHESDVKEAVIKLLQDELGLEILIQDSRSNPGREIQSPTPPKLKGEGEMDANNSIHHLDISTTARQPAVIHRIKVTRKSLNQWLQRREGNRKRGPIL